MNAQVTPPPIPRQSGSARLVLWVFSGLGVLLVLPPALFYPVENWRGKRAWEKCKRELEAKGEKLDWAAYIPPTVPDEQNVFKAPKMTEWFVGRNSNELAMRLHPDRLDTFCRGRLTNAVLELTIVSPDERIAPGSADLVLRYDSPILNPVQDSSNSSDPRLEIIPLVQFEDVPLRSAIQNLARQAGVKFVVDSKVDFRGSDGAEPLITGHWEDVTVLQVLVRVLNQHNLQWMDDPKTGVARIAVNPSGVPHVYVDPLARDQIGELIQRVVGQRTNDFPGPSMVGPQGFTFVVKPIGPVAPARVFVRSRTSPGFKSVAEFFPTNVPVSGSATTALRVESAGDRFRVLLSPPPYTVAEYLAWSDQFAPDFELIREALKRPCARLGGDYQNLYALRIPNFTAIRATAQTLVLRAQCHLLAGDPDKALRELTLIHDLCHLLDGKPTGQPMTLVAAMIHVSLTGLYSQTVADGLRLHAWREPHLAEIQSQLESVHLPELVTAAFRAEQASLEPNLEMILAKNGANSSVFNPSPWQKLRRLGLTSLPKGWYHQNLAVIARLEQRLIDGFDPVNNLVRKREVNAFTQELETIGAHFRPYTFYAAIVVPNFTRAIQTTARNQMLANQARIACALERHRIAHGEYPKTLDVLTPQLLKCLPCDIINGHPLKYRRTDDGFMLYSVGWNEMDDGGIAALKADGLAEERLGDWVWLPGK